MSVRSRIILAESVVNEDAHPNADNNYVIAYVEFPDGSLRPALFTDSDMQRAMKRAEKNSEDVKPPFVQPAIEPVVEKTWLDKILGR